MCEPHCLIGKTCLLVLEDEPALLEQVHRDSRQLGSSYDAERIERLRRDLRAREHARELGAPSRRSSMNRVERCFGELEPWPCSLDMQDDPPLELADALARVSLGFARS